MAKRKKIPEKYQKWIDPRKKYHLSHAHIQMARKLGMNPKKFGDLANTNPGALSELHQAVRQVPVFVKVLHRIP
jgi:hypothetical protein